MTQTLDSSARRRRHYWTALAALLIAVGGVLASVIGASSVAQTASKEARQQFVAASAQIASTLQLSIEHEQDLVVDGGGYVLGNPGGTESEFKQWTTTVQVLSRYPEIQQLGYLMIVPAAALASYAHQAQRSPNGPLPANGTFAVIPPGQRPYYCLAPAGVVRRPALLMPAGYDYCASPVLAASILASRDTGVSILYPYTVAKQPLLAIETPLYAGGTVPASAAARRTTFVALFATVIEPQVILDRALQGHPGVEVTLRYAQGATRATFPSGPIPRAPRVATIDLHNGWVVDTSTTAPGSGVFSNANAEGLLAAGVALSLLLAAFVLVLATTRTRALRLVDQRTKQLHHQALHDPLTGLANRTLVLDHAEQLLARSRRQGTTPAALFIDLDDFKYVNDTFGHQAGDRLLVAVAGRLATTIRAADTIGRLGGDEFVVLVDGSSLDVPPELVARRILDVMRQPFELDGVPLPISLNASVGIAEGDRESAGDLLRDADVALYLAKDEGKNRYATYQPVPANSTTRWAASTVPTPVDRS